MNKHWAVLLLAIAATQAFAGEKEYTWRTCNNYTGDGVPKWDCKQCTEKVGFKISFKVSKQLNSVMHTIIKPDGTSSSSVIKNCKIFDENSFECTETTETKLTETYYNYGRYETFSTANGTWEWKVNDFGHGAANLGITSKEQFSYACGEEIKNVFNFFK